MNNDQQLKILCANIKALRPTFNITQTQLTQIMKISPKTLSRLEAGEIPSRMGAKTLLRLAQFLHVEIKDLFQPDLLEQIRQKDLFILPQNRIRALREERGLPPQAVAKHLGCITQTYARYEAGRLQLSARAAIRLAELYGVSVDDLMGLTDQRKRH